MLPGKAFDNSGIEEDINACVIVIACFLIDET
jgi:hypothetical protein